MTDKTPAQEMDVAEVARGLTKAQREALVARVAFWTDRSEPATCWNDIGHPLKNMGLIQFSTPTGSATELTPLGLRVRHHLTGEQNDG